MVNQEIKWFYNQRGDNNQYIIDNSAHTHIIINSDTEWFWNVDQTFFDSLYDKGVRKVTFIFSSFNHSFYQNYYNHDKIEIEIIHWYSFWFNWAEILLRNSIDYKSVRYENFEYSFISLNNKSHNHRCALIDNLSEQGLLDKGIVSWNRFPFINDHYPFKHYDNSYRSIGDNFYTVQDSFFFCDQHHKSFLQVIGEATDSVPFITEKTVIPILLKKPFVVLSLPNYHQYLKHLGFEIYDEIINYNFDSCQNLDERAKKLVENLHDLDNQDLNNLYKKLYPKIEHNYNRAWEIIKDMTYIPKIVQDRVAYLNKNSDDFYDVDGRYQQFISQVITN